jgi:uncharacterized membrane protein
MKFVNLKTMIKENFVSGTFVLAPLVIFFVVFRWLFGGVLVQLQTLVPDHSAVFSLVLLLGILFTGVIIVSSLGFVSKLYLGRRFLVFIGQAIARIPIFGSVYQSLEQLMAAFGNSGSKQFRRVVLIEYPKKDTWAIAFVTGTNTLKALPEGYLHVFIPTVPIPTAGFHLMVKETDVRESGMKVDEAFKMIISLGVAQPHV